MENISSLTNDAIRMSIFSYIKTGNIVFDTIITTLAFTSFSYFMKMVYENNYKDLNLSNINIIDSIKYIFYKKNKIVMTGKKCSAVSWNCVPIISSVFSDRFKAVWDEIINNIETNPSIYEIEDSLTLTHTDDDEKKNNIFIVSQKTPFIFNKEHKIYATTASHSEERSNEKEKGSSKIENIEIVLYSYESSIFQIKNVIDELTDNYIKNIEKQRNSKRFIYTLIKTNYSEDRFECWKESRFETTRTFDNMFFENKSNIINKIDFFINNKEWYYKKGIPYTIGFGLHGPPGTGKTSFIKSLASYTKRHVIVLSLKLLKTRRQLQEFFYEDRYNDNNRKRSIDFSSKIIVIEDIDAQGDIVLDRSKRKTLYKKNAENVANTSNLMKQLLDNKSNDASKNEVTNIMKCAEEEPITLDDILNLWDGIEETSGRIIIISSNHYQELDPALTRPGRIDVTIEMKNASRDIIAEIYQHFYDSEINPASLKKIKPYLYSPAELINLYLMYKNDANAFLDRLALNKKLN